MSFLLFRIFKNRLGPPLGFEKPFNCCCFSFVVDLKSFMWTNVHCSALLGIWTRDLAFNCRLLLSLAYFFKMGPFPASFSLLFSSTIWMYNWYVKFCRCWVSNRGSLVSEATALLTEPSPSPNLITAALDWHKSYTCCFVANGFAFQVFYPVSPEFFFFVIVQLFLFSRFRSTLKLRTTTSTLRTRPSWRPCCRSRRGCKSTSRPSRTWSTAWKKIPVCDVFGIMKISCLSIFKTWSKWLRNSRT